MAKEYFIYCDESIESGKYYSDFYGGVLIESTYYDTITQSLNDKKIELNLNNEIKWTRVTENYLEKYTQLMDLFFDYIQENQIKIRIMFRQSAYEPVGLSQEQKDNGFFLLYYQFIKHAFGIKHIPENQIKGKVYLRLFFDELPDSPERCDAFKSQIYGLQSTKGFVRSNIAIRREDIVDVDSKQHVLLQCMDVILGAMAFRLNNLHKQKPEGATKRGKRTIAKEKLYKHLLKRIKQIRPNFNTGISTGSDDSLENIWSHPYRHWKFVPHNHRVDESKFK